MPIFEYRCESCGVITEHLERASDEALKRCPACNGKVTRVLSSPSIHMGSEKAGDFSCDRSAPCCGHSGVCGAASCGIKR